MHPGVGSEDPAVDDWRPVGRRGRLLGARPVVTREPFAQAAARAADLGNEELMTAAWSCERVAD